MTLYVSLCVLELLQRNGLELIIIIVNSELWKVTSVCAVVAVMGVTQLRDVVYVVCDRPSAVWMFDATTHQQLSDIDAFGLVDVRMPRDIAACEQTFQLYIADNWQCVWRVSTDGADLQYWLPRSPWDTFRPSSLSVKLARLLVTSFDPKELRQFDPNGDELRRVRLPDDIVPYHAVESPTGTFIVCLSNAQLQWQVSVFVLL